MSTVEPPLHDTAARRREEYRRSTARQHDGTSTGGVQEEYSTTARRDVDGRSTILYRLGYV